MSESTARPTVTVGLSSCGIAAGAGRVMETFREEIKKRGLDVALRRTGCVGMCYNEPIVDVELPGRPKATYGGVKHDAVARIIEDHIVGGEPVEDLLVRAEDRELPDESYYAPQVRVVLRNAGVIDPESIDEYIEVGGYEALEKVVTSMSPEDVIEVMKASGLRGRGGAWAKSMLFGLGWARSSCNR